MSGFDKTNPKPHANLVGCIRVAPPPLLNCCVHNLELWINTGLIATRRRSNERCALLNHAGPALNKRVAVPTLQKMLEDLSDAEKLSTACENHPQDQICLSVGLPMTPNDTSRHVNLHDRLLAGCNGCKHRLGLSCGLGYQAEPAYFGYRTEKRAVK